MEIDIEKMRQIIEKYPVESRFALAIMQDIQGHYQYIPKEGLNLLATYLSVSPMKLYSMATFYKALKLEVRGKHIIKACDGTACHIKGSPAVLSSIQRHLNILPGETTEDQVFSLETVNCLGACAVAPVVVIDDKYYPKMTDEKMMTILGEIRKGGIADE